MMRRILASLMLVSVVSGASLTPAMAQDAVKVIYQGEAQGSAAIGLSVIAKKVTLAEDATLVDVVISFDSHRTNSVNLNDEIGQLKFGDGQTLNLRAPEDDKYMKISTGTTMEGQLVFPGKIPAGTKEVTLVLNGDNGGDDISAPGVTVKIPVAAP